MKSDQSDSVAELQDNEELSELMYQKLIFTEDHEEFKDFSAGCFTSNTKSIFFWDSFNCWTLDYADLNVNKKKINLKTNFKKLALNIDNSSNNPAFIKKVTTGCSVDKISIKLF